MRQQKSSGSVKAIWLDKEKIFSALDNAASEAIMLFPEIKEIRLFGSLAKGEDTGLSDIDLFLLIESEEKNPIERVKPYFNYFSDKLNISLDLIVATPKELDNFKEILKNSILVQHH